MKPVIEKKINNVIKSLQNELAKSIAGFEKVAVYEGAAFASKNLPAASDSTIEPYLTRLRGHFLSLRKDVQVRLQAGLQKLLGADSIQTINEKISNIKTFVEDERKKRKHWLADISRLEMFGKKTAYKKVQVLVTLAALAESAQLVSNFLSVQDIALLAIIIGGLLGFLQSFAAKYAVQNIREISNPKQRTTKYVFMATAFICASLVIALFRHNILVKTTGKDVSITFFAFINLIPIAAVTFLTLFYYPSRQELHEIEHIEALQNNIDKSIAYEATLEKTKSKLLEERQQIAKVHGEFIHDEKELLLKVDANFDALVGILITENITKRTDNVFPPCFKVKHLPLSDPSDPSSFDQIK